MTPSSPSDSTPQIPSVPDASSRAAPQKQTTTRDYLAISLFWLAVSFFWGAMLFVVLQSRVQTLVERENSTLAKQAALLKTPAKPSSATNAATQNTAALNTTTLNSSTPIGATSQVAAQAQTAAQAQAKAARQKLDSLAASRLSWMLGAGALVAAVTQMLFGAISDRSRHRAGRRKPFLIAGVLLSNIGLFLFPVAQSYAMLFGVFLLIQFCLNVAAGPYQALLPDLVPLQHHGKAAAFMGTFQLIGRTGGTVAGALLMRTSYGLTLLTVCFVVLLNGLMLVTAFLTREQAYQPDMSTHAPQPGLISTLTESFRVDLRGQASYVWVLVSRFVINVGIYMIFPFLQYYLINAFNLTQDAALGQMATIAMIVNLTGLAATFPAGSASDRMPKKRVVYFSCSLAIMGGLGFALSGSVPYALVSAAVFGLGYGAFQAVDWALVCNVLPPGEPAKYMGLWGFADTIPQIVAPLLGGGIAAWMIGHYNANLGYRAIMMAAIFWFALGTFCIRFVRERIVATQSSQAAPNQNASEGAAPA